MYGAITFYLGHQAEVDAYILKGERELDQRVPPLSQTRPEVHARLQKARAGLARPQ